MAATIMMPQQIDLVIRERCSDVMSRAVAALADKYGFDQDEANRFLDHAMEAHQSTIREQANFNVDDFTVSGFSELYKELVVWNAMCLKAVAALADKYGFDEKEANLFLAERSAFASDAIFQDVVKVIAAHWKEENEETRPEWNAKAKTAATS